MDIYHGALNLDHVSRWNRFQDGSCRTGSCRMVLVSRWIVSRWITCRMDHVLRWIMCRVGLWRLLHWRTPRVVWDGTHSPIHWVHRWSHDPSTLSQALWGGSGAGHWNSTTETCLRSTRTRMITSSKSIVSVTWLCQPAQKTWYLIICKGGQPYRTTFNKCHTFRDKNVLF